MLNYFPKYLTENATIFFIVALIFVSVLFYGASMPFWLILFSLITVPMFFYGSNSLTKAWLNISPKNFTQNLFFGAFAIRLVYVIFIYYFNNAHYGRYYESDPGDIEFYVACGEQLAQYSLGFLQMTSVSSWYDILTKSFIGITDMGYIFYIGAVYTITGLYSEIILPLILKAVWGALTCVFAYKMATRHFGESTGRMAGIFCMLQFNMIWWCGSMMKETEMIFLFMLFANNADKVLYEDTTNVKSWIIAIVAGLSLYTFRSALCMVCFLALFAQVIMSSHKVMGIGKKIFAGLIVAAVIALAFGDSISDEFRQTEAIAGGQYQQTNMEWRAERDGGNSFAKYAGAAVFAPLIFTIPFPTIVYTDESQEMLMMVAGGNYVKNVMSFFVIAVMFYMLLKGKWREHVFPIALLCGYLAALVLSVFAQSGRFHMPIIPLEMMFAAYGVSLMQNKHKQWFMYALAFEFVIIVAWSWFKLAGRGMV